MVFNPTVYPRRVDLSVLTFSLSSHRHSYISLFTFYLDLVSSFHNKRLKKTNRHCRSPQRGRTWTRVLFTPSPLPSHYSIVINHFTLSWHWPIMSPFSHRPRLDIFARALSLDLDLVLFCHHPTPFLPPSPFLTLSLTRQLPGVHEWERE